MKRLIIFLIPFCNFMVAQNINSGLIAYYPFSGNANDVSGNAHNGYISGGVIDSTDRFGNTNSAYYFDGQLNSYIKILNSPALNNFQELSISLWYNKIDTIRYRSGFIGKQRQFNSCGSCYFSPTFEFMLRKDPDSWAILSRQTSIGSRFGKFFNHTPTLSTWTHIVYSWDADSIRTYLNGVFQNSDATPSNFTFVDDTSLIKIGYVEGVAGYSGTWKGFLDDIRIYNRAITKEEVGQLFENSVDLNLSSKINSKLFVYPNPSNSKELYLNKKNVTEPTTIQIYDNLGKFIKRLEFTGNSFTPDLSPGLYFFKISTTNSKDLPIIEKVIIY